MLEDPHVVGTESPTDFQPFKSSFSVNFKTRRRKTEKNTSFISAVEGRKGDKRSNDEAREIFQKSVVKTGSCRRVSSTNTS